MNELQHKKKNIVASDNLLPIWYGAGEIGIVLEIRSIMNSTVMSGGNLKKIHENTNEL